MRSPSSTSASSCFGQRLDDARPHDVGGEGDASGEQHQAGHDHASHSRENTIQRRLREVTACNEHHSCQMS